MAVPAEPEVIIWTNRGCGACVRAKQLFERKKVAVKERRLKASRNTQLAFARATNHAKSVPQILINGRLIGGFDNLAQLERSGELDVLLGFATSLPKRSFTQRLFGWLGLS